MENRNLQFILDFIRILLPEIQAVIGKIEKNGGYLSLPDKFTSLTTKDGLPPWSSFYDKPQTTIGFIARFLFDQDRLSDIRNQLRASTPDQIPDLRRKIQQGIFEEIRELGFDAIAADVPSDEAEAIWTSMDEPQRAQAAIQLCMMQYGILILIHNYFSLLTYGRQIWDLVEDAKSGTDDAFFKVVRIDRTTLFGIPYFQKRLVRAQLGKDPMFNRKLANAVKATPLGSKYKHKMLQFVFMILDDEGLLYTLSQEQLMDVCEELGVYGHAHGVDDSASLRKLLNQYKRKTRRQNQI